MATSCDLSVSKVIQARDRGGDFLLLLERLRYGLHCLGISAGTIDAVSHPGKKYRSLCPWLFLQSLGSLEFSRNTNAILHFFTRIRSS